MTMHLQYNKTILNPDVNKIDYWKNRVLATCFSPDNQRLAIVTSDRYVSLFNENGEKVDKFCTKQSGKDSQGYTIR